MFFPEKIRSIQPSDRVLEIGPGGTPFHRSDVFLEKRYSSEDEWQSQRGGMPRLSTEKPIFFYDGGRFPFEDGEFDYLICSHVIEHVENLEFFLSEVFRVASRGYIEYPTIYYEYLYNFHDHLNFVKLVDGKLVYLRKDQTNLDGFLQVQKFFFESLRHGHSKHVEELKRFMFEGFEWEGSVEVRQASGIDELVFRNFELPAATPNACLLERIVGRLRRGIVSLRNLISK